MTPNPDTSHLKKIQKTLSFLANTLNSLKINWLLGGSGALMVHGINLVPRDLDVLISPQDLSKFVSAFKIYIPEGDNDLKYSINGVEIELVLIPNLGHPLQVPYLDVLIPVNTLEDELHFYQQRPGKEEIVKLIKEKL
ncbi:MAG: hypothetical protein WCT01_00145 [Candidatus Shapirobacteria bacterium]|jgi:hypothetical protein